MEVVGDLGGRGVALFGMGVGGPADDGVKARIAVTDCGCGAEIIGREGAGEELVKHHAEGKNIGAIIDGVRRVDHFRSGVVWRAENFLSLLGFDLDGSGEAEIADFGLGVEV